MTRDKILSMPAGRDKLLKFFYERVDISNGNCWNWIGHVCKRTGYGMGSPSHHKKYLAHRLSYELFVGVIPNNLQIDHICRNRKCTNPEHLRVVTAKENVLCGEGITAKNARKTHCPHGHEYGGNNLYIKPSGARVCRTCKRKTDRERRKTKSLRSPESTRRRLYALKGINK